MLLSFLSNAAAWEPWQGNTMLKEATPRDDLIDYKLREGMRQAELTLKLWSRAASVTAGSCRVSRGLGNKIKRLHLQNYLWYSEVINKHVRASTFQAEVRSSLLLAIMVKIIICVSDKTGNLREKKPNWKHENILTNLASHKPCEVGILICTLQRRKLQHGEIASCPGPGRKPREQLNRAPSSWMPALCFGHKIIFPFLHLIIFKRIKLGIFIDSV